MLPEIIFSVLLAAIGIVIFIALPKLFTKPPKDYSNNPVIEGTVLHQEDFCGRRWLVSFYDEHGAEHLAMDDQLSSDTFHPERFAIPKTGQMKGFACESVQMMICTGVFIVSTVSRLNIPSIFAMKLSMI